MKVNHSFMACLWACLLPWSIAYAVEPSKDPQGWASEVNVIPEVKQIIKVSNRDHNWVRCTEPIGDVVFSAEDGVKVTTSGKNAYVKFQWTTNPETGEAVRPRDRTDLFIECGGEVYKILALPVNIESRTLILVPGKGKALGPKPTAATTKEDSLTRMLEVIRLVWRSEVDDAWQVAKKDEDFELKQGITLNLIKEVRIEGEGMRVKEYLVQNHGNPRRVLEKEFLIAEVSKSPLAVAFAAQDDQIDQQFLNHKGKGRLVLVEHINEDFGLPLIREAKE